MTHTHTRIYRQSFSIRKQNFKTERLKETTTATAIQENKKKQNEKHTRRNSLACIV